MKGRTLHPETIRYLIPYYPARLASLASIPILAPAQAHVRAGALRR